MTIASVVDDLKVGGDQSQKLPGWAACGLEFPESAREADRGCARDRRHRPEIAFVKSDGRV